MILRNFAINSIQQYYDTYAATLISLTSTTNTKFQNSIHNFYAKLKRDNLYNKFIALYIPIFNSEIKSKWNWVNLADTDAAYRATISGTSSYELNRVYPVSSASFNTHLLNTSLNIQDVTLGSYDLENAVYYDNDYGSAIGAYELSVAFKYLNTCKINLGSTHQFNNYNKPNGLYIATRNNNNVQVYLNKNKLYEGTATSDTLTESTILFPGMYNLSTFRYTNIPFNLKFIATGFSESDIINFNNAVNILFSNINTTIPANNAYFYGDSITCHQLTHDTWPYVLSSSRGWTITPRPAYYGFTYDYARNGATARTMYELALSRLSNYDSTDSVVFIAVGVNDLITNGTVATFQNYFTLLLDWVITRGFPLNKIKVCNLWYITNFQLGSREKADQINAVISTITTNKGVQMIDVWNFMETNEMNPPDGVHPSAEQSIANANYINSVLTF